MRAWPSWDRVFSRYLGVVFHDVSEQLLKLRALLRIDATAKVVAFKKLENRPGMLVKDLECSA